jgi:hypothetical protein
VEGRSRAAPGSAVGGGGSQCRFLGEMSDILHSYAPLPLIPPTPFSHKGRRGSLGVLMPETGDGAQGLAKNLPL